MQNKLRLSQKAVCLLGLCLIFLLAPSLSWSANILFYFDGIEGSKITHCADLLKSSNNTVKIIDVAGESYDPSNDNWANYDQVWDMRIVNSVHINCGSGSPDASDYFGNHWSAKAIYYLNHCGRLFISAEAYKLTNRDEGLYIFLKKTGAVTNDFDTCPPSFMGNNGTTGYGFYPVKNNLGPVSFYGYWVGGIPLTTLSGTNFVDTTEHWFGNDNIDRSIVSGWEGNQLRGAINAPLCQRGKLFIVWDDSMWVPELLNSIGRSNKVKQAKEITDKFFPAIAQWLGSGPCPCITPIESKKLTSATVVNPIVTSTSTATPTHFTPVITSVYREITATLLPEKIPHSHPMIKHYQIPTLVTPTLTITATPTFTIYKTKFNKQKVFYFKPTPTLTTFVVKKTPIPKLKKPTHIPIPISTSTASAPQTIIFNAPPVDVYITFADGPGRYQLEVLDSNGHHLQTIFDQNVTTTKEGWASWDGKNETDQMMVPGVYTTLFTKDGKLLKRIVLIWNVTGN